MTSFIDINTVRIAVTLLGFAAFAWLVGWTWSRSRRAAFDAAAQLPFEDAAASPPRSEGGAAARPAGPRATRGCTHE